MSGPITIAVVSWNTRDLLRRCLESLRADAGAGRCDVWVVDNASRDGSAEMVRGEFRWVKLIASKENLGFGPAVNEVARRTTASWIVPANADVEVMPGALDALMQAASDPSVGIVAPRLVMEGGETQHSVHAFPTLPLALAFAVGAYHLPGVGDRLCVEGYWQSDRRREIDWAHGAFLLVRRDAFDAVGGFDPHQWMYAEDIDIHWRLRRAGFRARYEPNAAVRHTVSAAAVKAFGKERTKRHLLAAYAWQARRRGVLVAWACAAVNGAGSGARWGVLALAAAVAKRHAPARDRFAIYTRAHLSALRPRRRLEEAVAKPAA